MKKTKKTSSSGKKKTSINSSSLKKKFFVALLIFLAGGALFNIDRIAHVDIDWHKIHNLLPYKIRKFIPGLEPASGTVAKGQRISGTVTNVYDGDTITVLSDDGSTEYKIRFYGIDAPERKQEYGENSRSYLASLVYRNPVEVQIVSTDRYGRNVGIVFVNGTNVNEAMVLNGCAWYYEEYAKGEKRLSDNQYSAMKNRRGLWAAEDPVPPWRYRNK